MFTLVFLEPRNATCCIGKSGIEARLLTLKNFLKFKTSIDLSETLPNMLFL